MLERYDPRNWPISYDGVIHTLIVLGYQLDTKTFHAAAHEACTTMEICGNWSPHPAKSPTGLRP